RAYKPHYEAGPFGKTLLKSIDQLDSKDQFVATQSFDYYNDVEKGMFEKEETKYTSEPNNYGVLVSTRIGHFDDRLSLLGGGSSKGNTAGGGLMVGIGWGPATANAGASYSYTKSENEGCIALVDINGDGLPDNVWKGNDGKLHYRLNLNKDSKHPTFGNVRDIDGIKSFSLGSTSSNTTNANFALGFGPGSLGYAIGKTTDQTKTKIYFQDFNSDGLIDIAQNGTVFFNHSDGEKVFFSASSSNTGNVILSSEPQEIDKSFIPDYEAIRDSLERQYPLHDAVRLWRAPYNGIIKIESTVKKVSSDGDGVTLSMQKNSDVLWRDILQSGTMTVPEKNLTVNSGDYILFRVGANYSGKGDAVLWDPLITYTSLKVNTVAGVDITHYSSSSDYIEGDASTAPLSIDGIVKYEGEYSKEKTSDDIVLALLKTDKNGVQTQVDSIFIAADSVVNGNFAGSYMSVANDSATIDFVIKTNSPIDWQKVKWNPVFHSDTIKYTISPQRFMFNKNITLEADTLQNVDLFVSDSTWSKGFTIVPTFKVNRTSSKDKSATDVYMTIKDDAGSLIFKHKFILSENNSIEEDSVKVDDEETALKLTNSRVQVTFATHNELSSCASAQIQILRDSLIYSDSTVPELIGSKAVVVSTLPASVYSSFNRFDYGQLYKGWGQFAWNGNNPARIKVDEMKANEKSDYLNEDGTANLKAMEENTVDINEQKFFTMAYKAESDKYFSSTDSVYINSIIMRPSRLGEDEIIIDTIDYNIYEDGLCAPVQKSESKSNSKTYNAGVSIGASIGVNESNTSQHSYTIVSAMDINGDGYPDWINDHDGSVMAQLTSPRGTLSKERLDYDVENSYYVGEASNVGTDIGFSSNPDSYHLKSLSEQIKQAKNCFTKTMSSIHSVGRLDKDAFSASFSGGSTEGACSASGNYSSGSNETIRDWEDLNGDGLPDMVSKGYVRYNLGYGFTEKIPIGLNNIEKSINSNYGDGLGFSVTVLGTFGISSGMNDGASVTYTTGRLCDINGDGLPDYILQNADGSLSVLTNTGHQFTSAEGISNKANIGGNIGSSVAIYASTAHTSTIHLPFGFRINITPSIQASHSESISRTIASLMDIDGDGLPDLVYSDDENHLYVRRNLTGRTNMLRSVTLPMGGKINIGYSQTTPSYDHPGRKWVMSSVETTGGYEENGAVSSKNTFEYEGGYRDRRERDFYG
ncbi:MAG: type IV secretion protein Rhs, partial [Bacteroidaceae bacterium]|nr:type IV secretion protein Rhs [Bacteroidaceae bacterium]